MPVNKNALLRYKIIDRSLRNRYRRWTIEDLVDAVSDALYDMEGIQKGVSLFYRYANPNYSITELPLTNEDVRLIDKAVDLLAKAEGQPELQATGRVLKRVRRRLIAILNFG